MTRRSAAFTLVEVVVAAALLAALSAACVPLMRSLTIPPPTPPAMPIEELADIADEVLRTPQRFDLSHESLASDAPLNPIDWPPPSSDGTHVPSPSRRVTITKLAPGDDSVDRHWLIFGCEGIAAARCVARVPPSSREGSTP